MASLNINNYSLEKKSVAKGSASGNATTPYSSSKGLAKTKGGQGRAPQYTLESQKK